MSYLTDMLRAPFKEPEVTVPGQMLDEIVAQNPARRTLLKNSLGLSVMSVFGATTLAACGSDGDSPPDSGGGTPAPDYSVNFTPLAGNIIADTVTVPEGYVAEVLYSAGDKCVAGSVGYTGAKQAYPVTDSQAGGQHDGMHFYPLDGVDPNKGGLLVMNHENLDDDTLDLTTGDAVKTRLSNVGVSVIEIAQGEDGAWAVKEGSMYNKRYTGNSLYTVSGPAAAAVGATVIGTLNNCASGPTPWGTYLTCEETTNNYFDGTQPAEGYGWVVEIDPYLPASTAVKRTAMGRFAHENTAYMTDADNRVAFYMGDDSTPGCIYKFVPEGSFDPDNRAANTTLLDEGTLYVAKFNGNGSGEWLELAVGKNGLVVGATDPGNFTQVAAPATTGPGAGTVDFNTQADVLINTQRAARVAGGTLMDRPEWITVGTDGTVLCTLTNNGSRRQTDPSNPRASNPHGHIVRWKEEGNSPLATTFTWDILLLAGKEEGAPENETGNINGDIFSCPDGIRVDPQGRLWVQTDMGNTDPNADYVQTFGNNSMYQVDQETGESKRFLVGPLGCEITGIAYTPDLKTFFINIQHPNTDWNIVAGGDARSATVVVRRTDGKPVGA